jgi:hypothetical protein
MSVRELAGLVDFAAAAAVEDVAVAAALLALAVVPAALDVVAAALDVVATLDAAVVLAALLVAAVVDAAELTLPAADVVPEVVTAALPPQAARRLTIATPPAPTVPRRNARRARAPFNPSSVRCPAIGNESPFCHSQMKYSKRKSQCNKYRMPRVKTHSSDVPTRQERCLRLTFLAGLLTILAHTRRRCHNIAWI